MINQLTVKKGTPYERTIRIEVIGKELSGDEKLMIEKCNELLSGSLSVTCEHPEYSLDKLMCLSLDSVAEVMLRALQMMRGGFPF